MTQHRWPENTPGVMQLPSGRLVRGRAVRDPPPAPLHPDFGLYLSGREPGPFPWAWRWLRWQDLWLPADRVAARDALVETWQRAAVERVEVACGHGRGRTGTALACLAMIDGVPAEHATAFVRRSYHPKAVEAPWQRRYVARFTPLP